MDLASRSGASPAYSFATRSRRAPPQRGELGSGVDLEQVDLPDDVVEAVDPRSTLRIHLRDGPYGQRAVAAAPENAVDVVLPLVEGDVAEVADVRHGKAVDFAVVDQPIVHGGHSTTVGQPVLTGQEGHAESAVVQHQPSVPQLLVGVRLGRVVVELGARRTSEQVDDHQPHEHANLLVAPLHYY